jgi:hypothetical protein
MYFAINKYSTISKTGRIFDQAQVKINIGIALLQKLYH